MLVWCENQYQLFFEKVSSIQKRVVCQDYCHNKTLVLVIFQSFNKLQTTEYNKVLVLVYFYLDDVAN